MTTSDPTTIFFVVNTTDLLSEPTAALIDDLYAAGFGMNQSAKRHI